MPTGWRWRSTDVRWYTTRRRHISSYTRQANRHIEPSPHAQCDRYRLQDANSTTARRRTSTRVQRVRQRSTACLYIPPGPPSRFPATREHIINERHRVRRRSRHLANSRLPALPTLLPKSSAKLPQRDLKPESPREVLLPEQYCGFASKRLRCRVRYHIHSSNCRHRAVWLMSLSQMRTFHVRCLEPPGNSCHRFENRRRRSHTSHEFRNRSRQYQCQVCPGGSRRARVD